MEDNPIISFLRPIGSPSNPVAAEILRGTWPEAAAARRLRLADGHYAIERVLEDEPDVFRYQVYLFTNAAGRGVTQIVGEQRFVPVEGGTEFRWAYNVLPRDVLTRQVVRGDMDDIAACIGGGLKRLADAVRADR